MKGIILKMTPEYDKDAHKGQWFNAEIKIKPTDKEAKKSGITKFQIGLAPDNKITRFKNREFEFNLARNGKSYYPKLSAAEREKSNNYKGGGRSTSSAKPEKKFKSSGGGGDKKTQLNYFCSSSLQIIAAKITQGNKELAKMSNDESLDEALRMANKLYKKIHK